MNISVLVLLAVLFLAGCVLGAFVMLVIGIHTEERNASLTDTSCTPRTATVTRRLLGVYVRNDAQITDTDNVRK